MNHIRLQRIIKNSSLAMVSSYQVGIGLVVLFSLSLLPFTTDKQVAD